MTVADLIDFLKTQQQDLPVAYACFSEYCLLSAGDIGEMLLCEARPDGWIQRSRRDMPAVAYLVFPGN